MTRHKAFVLNRPGRNHNLLLQIFLVLVTEAFQKLMLTPHRKQTRVERLGLTE